MDDVAALIKDDAFLLALCRYAEGGLSEQAVRKRFRLLEESDWIALAKNDELVRKIEDLKALRVSNGSLKRERAQAAVVKAPAVLEQILLSESASPKHRIDSARTLDHLSGGPESVPPADRFSIVINLSADGSPHTVKIDKPYSKDAKDVTPAKVAFNKSIQPEPRDIDAEIIDHDSETAGFCAAIAARKDGNEGGGAPR
jgi:hypothetical protein